MTAVCGSCGHPATDHHRGLCVGLHDIGRAPITCCCRALTATPDRKARP